MGLFHWRITTKGFGRNFIWLKGLIGVWKSWALGGWVPGFFRQIYLYLEGSSLEREMFYLLMRSIMQVEFWQQGFLNRFSSCSIWTHNSSLMILGRLNFKKVV